MCTPAINHHNILGLEMKVTDIDLKQITNNFADVIGHGGFGVVYKGCYRHVDVAVKMLNKVMSTLLILLL